MDRAALRSLAAKLFADVAACSCDGEGITRESYGPTESTALALVERFAQREGLTTARDAAQNLVVSLPDEASDAAIYVGSHLDSVPLDSVPQGGNFDGLAGVVVGLLVLTFGIVSTDPRAHAMSRIPGEVALSFEVRSQSRETLQAFYELFHTECESVATKRNVGFEFDRRLETPPGRLDERWVARLLELSGPLGLPAETVPSGAGHDAAMFAAAGVPCGMIFIRNEHGSHNPHEAMEVS